MCVWLNVNYLCAPVKVTHQDVFYYTVKTVIVFFNMCFFTRDRQILFFVSHVSRPQKPFSDVSNLRNVISIRQYLYSECPQGINCSYSFTLSNVFNYAALPYLKEKVFVSHSV